MNQPINQLSQYWNICRKWLVFTLMQLRPPYVFLCVRSGVYSLDMYAGALVWCSTQTVFCNKITTCCTS